MIRLAVLSALTLPAIAFAQVSVNPNALSSLKSDAPASAAARPATGTARRAPTRPARRAAEHPASKTHPKTASKPQPTGVPPAQASAAPPPAVLAPVQPPPVPAKPPSPPPPVPIVPEAPGKVMQIPGGIRLTFGEGSAALNPAMATALETLGQAVRDKPDADLNIYAYAAGVPDDPSTPRRLSLSRALAARAILINQGIASTRIYPRALGATPSDGPPDRVDVVQNGPGSQPPPSGEPAH